MATTARQSLERATSDPAIAKAFERFEEELDRLTRTELLAVIEGTTRALGEPVGPVHPVVALLSDGQRSSPEERVETKIAVLLRSFERRRELLAGALTASQVAKLLGTSRQTPHDRVAAGTLLAVMDRGALRFPPWQFDANGEDGVVSGLPTVIRALEVPPMTKISWLTRPNTILDGATPVDSLKRGEIERVVVLARGVGVY